MNKSALIAAHRALALAALLAGAQAHAGGLAAYNVGSADVGLASAGAEARAADPSTIYANPAGMTRLKGTQVLLGVQALYADVEFDIDAGTSPGLGSKSGGNAVGWFPGGGVFVTHQVSPALTLGFGSASSFGLGLEYDKSWAGRYYGREAALIGLSLLPSVAYKLNDKLSLGASVNATYGILKNKVAINNVLPGSADGSLTLKDAEWSWGVNLGLLYEFSPSTRLGLAYKSEVDLDFSARADFDNIAPGLLALLNASGLNNAKIGMDITIPQGVGASLFHQASDRWALLASLGWQQWSKFGHMQISVDSTNPVSATTDLKFKDTWHAALGAQYRISQPWLLNFGVAYDSNFQKSSNVSPALPSNGAWMFGVGLQNQAAKDFEWGVAAQYIYGGHLETRLQGAAPAIGGRGNLVGHYDPRVYFLSANFIWKY